MPFVLQVLTHPLATLFVVVTIGLWLGAQKIRGISLGAAGVLFAALLAGHARQFVPESELAARPETLTIPKSLTDFGLVMFVYAVGLQAGPRFVPMFRARAKSFLMVGLGSAALAAATAILIGRALHLDPALVTGVFTGALTNTPALAAGRDIVQNLAPNDVTTVSVGHGLAYPFSAIFVVVLVQILPRLLRCSPEEAAAQAARDSASPPLDVRKFRITNPNLVDMSVSEFQALDLCRATISRVKREGVVYPARPDLKLSMHDVILAVGPSEELSKLDTVLGTPADDESMLDPSGKVASETIVVSRPSAIGATLHELQAGERFGVVVTRVRREGIDLTPEPTLGLEPGDILRVVGQPTDIEQFSHVVGREEERLSETSLLSFAAGVAIGAAVGLVPIPLPGGLRATLGLGGGAFVVALVMGHFGRIGPLRVYVPQAAKLLARELGLVVFLAGAGVEAGARFWEVLLRAGPQALLAGAAVTTVAAVGALVLMHRVLRWNMLATAGALSAAMTNPPAFSAATGLAKSDAPALAFASVYPVAILAKIILAQLVFVLTRL